MNTVLLIVLLGFIGLVVIVMLSLHRVAKPGLAHLVITASGKSGVYASDKNLRTDGAGVSYFAIPDYIPYFGKVIRLLDVTIKELIFEQDTVEKDQARYMITSSTKYKTVDVTKAAEAFIDDEGLAEQLKEIIQAAVREITVKFDIVNARAKRQEIGEKILESIKDDFANWGVELVNFVLVDFKDAPGTTTVTDISLRREVEINTQTRQQNAEKVKVARMKEAEADKQAQEAEISRDKVVAERQQEQKTAVSEKEKIAQEAAFEVVKVQTVAQAEITKEANVVKANEDKEVSIVRANQQKESEEILKQQKKLEGEGDRLKAEEIAKGQAAPIREIGNAEANIIEKKLLAEAIGKDKLQASLNKFTESAIIALTAELQINANKEVGIAGAQALTNADMKVFAGSDNGGGFDIGKTLAQIGVANTTTENALHNKMARPNDMGLSAIALKELADKKAKVKKPMRNEKK